MRIVPLDFTENDMSRFMAPESYSNYYRIYKSSTTHACIRQNTQTKLYSFYNCPSNYNFFHTINKDKALPKLFEETFESPEAARDYIFTCYL